LQSIIITGASSGIGKAAAIRLARSGYQVFGLARKYEQLVNLSSEIPENKNDNSEKHYFPIECDITKQENFDDILNNIINLSSEKTIFGLVNNAGYLEPGAIEDLEIDNFRAQFETNFFGLVGFTKKVLPIMMCNNRGRIVNVSSISGLVSLPLLGAYSASKYALEAAMDALRMEIWRTGIKIININPAIIETNLHSVSKNKIDNLIEKSRLSNAYKRYMSKMPPGLSPGIVADVIVEAVSSAEPKLRYIIGPKKVKLTVKLRCFIPDKIFFSQVAKRLS
jgi:short-subunit dehydrogenase